MKLLAAGFFFFFEDDGFSALAGVPCKQTDIKCP
jgi:hypothetical protein